MSLKKMCYTLTLLILLLFLWGFSQQVTTQWETIGGGVGDDRINAMVKLPDGYAVAGQLTDTRRDFNPYLAKFNLEGELLWSQNYHLTEVSWETKKMITLKDGGFCLLVENDDILITNSDGNSVKAVKGFNMYVANLVLGYISDSKMTKECRTTAWCRSSGTGLTSFSPDGENRNLSRHRTRTVQAER